MTPLFIQRITKRTIPFLCIPVFLFCALQCGEFAYAQDQMMNDELLSGSLVRQEGKMDVLLVLIPGLAFDDVDDLMDALPLSIKEKLQIGAMTLRTANGMNSVQNLITLSTGKQEEGLKEWSGYQQNENVDEIRSIEWFEQRTGKSSEAAILHPDIYKLHKQWASKGSTYPGWLGDTLASHNIYTVALGNSDVFDKKQRWAPAFIMNKDGEAEGIIDQRILFKSSTFPTGYHTNWAHLTTVLERTWVEQPQSFIAVELGDLERILAEKEYMTEQHLEKIKRQWFNQLGEWVTRLRSTYVQIAQENPKKELSILLLSPYVSQDAHRDGKDLAPFLHWSLNQEGGIVASKTTKQSGIVSNLDFLPTLLSLLGISKPPDLPGQVIHLDHSLTKTAHLPQLEEWRLHLEYLFTIYNQRRPIITTYIVILLAIMIFATVYWLFFKEKRNRPWLHILIGSILLSPFFFLVLTPVIKVAGGTAWIFILLTGSLLSSLLLYNICSFTVFIGLIGWINTLAVILDIWRGSPWMQRSFLGFDPLIGARYYGIGNEYAGILLGASVLAIVSLSVWLEDKCSLSGGGQGGRWGRLYPIAAAIWFLFIVYTVGAPQLGTNAGATVASIFTYLLAISMMLNLRFSFKHVMVCAMLVLIGVWFFIMLHWRGEHTHIGAVLHMVAAGEILPLLDVIQRKLELNLKLIRVSLWGKLFVTSLLVLLIMLFQWNREKWSDRKKWSNRKKGSNREKWSNPRKNHWLTGMRTIVIGSALLLILNDSGIVAAATAMIYGTFPFISLKLSDRQMEVIRERDTTIR